MNRRYFFKSLASGLVAAATPTLFLPKLIKPVWRPLATPTPGMILYAAHLEKMLMAAKVEVAEYLRIDMLQRLEPIFREFQERQNAISAVWH